MGLVIGNGLPHKPCGAIPGMHEVHTYAEDQTEPNFWCDGVPVLGSFIELVVRVPLTGELDQNGTTHEETLADVLEEPDAYLWDEVGGTTSRTALRVRHGGKDQVYPLRYVNGALTVVQRDARD